MLSYIKSYALKGNNLESPKPPVLEKVNQFEYRSN